VGAVCPWNGSADLGRGSVVRGGGRRVGRRGGGGREGKKGWMGRMRKECGGGDIVRDTELASHSEQ